MSLQPGVWSVTRAAVDSADLVLVCLTRESPAVAYGTVVAPTGSRLVASTSGSRSNPVDLAGATITEPIAVFTTPDEGVTSVDFYIDGVFERVERTGPFDLKGGTGVDAILWTPPTGAVQVSAVITRGVSQETVTAAFTYAPPVVVDPDPDPDPEPEPEPDPPIVGGGSFPLAAALASTGPTGALTNSGTITTTQDGQVIEGVNVSGQIRIRHNNVTVRNFRITYGGTGNALDMVNASADGSRMRGVLIEDGDIWCNGSNGAQACVGGLFSATDLPKVGDAITARRIRVRGFADGFKASPWGLYQNILVQMTRAPGTAKHVDGFQASGQSNWTVEDSWFPEPYAGGHNSAIFAQPFTGARNVPLEGITIRRNHVNGGTYSLQFGQYKSNYPLPSNPEPQLRAQAYDNVHYRGFLYGGFLRRNATITAPQGAVIPGRWADTGAQTPSGPA